MALNQIYIPDLNPIRFVPEGPIERPTFRNDWFVNQIMPWQHPAQYFQKWLIGSTVFIQLASNFGPLQLDIINCYGGLIQSYTPQAITTTYYNPTLVTYQVQFPAPATMDLWYARLTAGFEATTTRFLSEPQQTVSSLKNLMQIDYWNSSNDQDVYFDGGLKFRLYVEAIRGQLTPKTKRTVWEDQPLNLSTIKGIPYQQFKFIFGDAYGIPEYMGAKLAAIHCLDNVLHNGVQHTQVEGAEWEVNQVENYPMFGYKTDMRPTKNVEGLQSENNNSPAESFAVVYNIETKAFGTFNGNVNSNIVQITEVD